MGLFRNGPKEAAALGKRHAEEDAKAKGFGKGWSGDRHKWDEADRAERVAYQRAYDKNRKA